MDTFYGLIDDDHRGEGAVYYIANAKMPLMVLRRVLAKQPYAKRSSVNRPKEITREDLEAFQEEQGALGMKYQVVTTDYEITSADQDNRIDLPFYLHSHDPETALKHLETAKDKHPSDPTTYGSSGE